MKTFIDCVGSEVFDLANTFSQQVTSKSCRDCSFVAALDFIEGIDTSENCQYSI